MDTMIGKEIEGKIVVSDTMMKSPLSKKGKDIFFKNIRELEFEDGSKIYSSGDYSFFSPQWGKVKAVISKPYTRKSSVENNVVGKLKAMQAEIEKLRASNERVVNQRNDWRKRAIAAEKDLKTINNILG